MTSIFSLLLLILKTIFLRLTQLLEDVQKVLSINIDENDEQTLVKISEDLSTLRNLWTKVRQQNPEQTLAGREVDFWHLSLSFLCSKKMWGIMC